MGRGLRWSPATRSHRTISTRWKSPMRRRSSARSAGARSYVELARPESVADAVAALGNGAVAFGGGTEVVPLLNSRIVRADTLVELRRAVPRGIDGTTIGAGTTLGELEVDPEIPEALREACRLSASPQLRATGTIGAHPPPPPARCDF